MRKGQGGCNYQLRNIRLAGSNTHQILLTGFRKGFNPRFMGARIKIWFLQALHQKYQISKIIRLTATKVVVSQ